MVANIIPIFDTLRLVVPMVVVGGVFAVLVYVLTQEFLWAGFAFLLGCGVSYHVIEFSKMQGRG